MPCSDGGPARDMYENDREYGLAVSSDALSRQVACEMAKIIVKNHLDDELSDLTKKWIYNHDMLDSKRK